MPFSCSICEEESTRICVNCTKDTCGNHLCDKCGSCSDCCDCEVTLDRREPIRAVPVREAYPLHDGLRESQYRDLQPREPQPPHPLPDPQPLEEPEPEPEPVSQ